MQNVMYLCYRFLQEKGIMFTILTSGYAEYISIYKIKCGA